MPRQGNTVESCIIVNWKVKEGDSVTSETIVCEVETDKASFEIPAGACGTVLKILYNTGDDVPVLSPIAVIGSAGEEWVIPQDNENPRKDTETQNTQKEEKSSEQILNSSALVSQPSFSVSPRARNLAIKEALALEFISGSGPEGRIIEYDVKMALENRPALTAATKASSGLIPEAGCGIGGRVTLKDITSTPKSISSFQNSQLPAYTETPVKGIRKVISDRMLKSLSETAQFTLNTSAPVSKLQDIRSRMNSTNSLSEEVKSLKITVNDLILFIVSRVLPNFSYMNARKTGDILRTFEQIHLGVAVDTQRGLMVPVIRNANLLSLAQISTETKRLAAACQNGSIKPDELSGSTFTVTNLGSLGITSFTPVLNEPEVAILGVCGIEMKPVVSISQVNGCGCGYIFEPHIGFSLTINHQVVDGAPAARFLKALCEAVMNIDLLLAAG
jgi:pyruvate dehydrogenase E2 component (dihydrolipoamide acetyltransferase)